MVRDSLPSENSFILHVRSTEGICNEVSGSSCGLQHSSVFDASRHCQYGTDILTAAWAAWPLKKCCVPLHELQRGNERVWNVRYESLRVCLEVLVPRWYCGMVEPSQRSFQTVCVI